MSSIDPNDTFYLKRIMKHIETWSQFSTEKMRPFVTISRQYGSGGWALAKKIEEKVNLKKEYDPPWFSFNKEMITMLMEDQQLLIKLGQSLGDLSEKTIEDFFSSHIYMKATDIAIFKKLCSIVRTMVDNGHVIIVGRGATFITQHLENGFRLRVVAPFKTRVQEIANRKNISLTESELLVNKMDHKRVNFIRDHFCVEVSDPLYYCLTINRGDFDLEKASDLVIEAMIRKGLIVF